MVELCLCWIYFRHLWYHDMDKRYLRLLLTLPHIIPPHRRLLSSPVTVIYYLGRCQNITIFQIHCMWNGYTCMVAGINIIFIFPPGLLSFICIACKIPGHAVPLPTYGIFYIILLKHKIHTHLTYNIYLLFILLIIHHLIIYPLS